MSVGHIPVLLEPIVSLLAPRPGDVVLDCTAGLGGHAAALAARIGAEGTVVLMDLDPGNLQSAAARLAALPAPPRTRTIHASFVQAPARLRDLSLAADILLADLGFASTQMDAPERGFSFMRDGPLDMRLDPTSPITAAELVNSLPEQELANLLHEFGEEPDARRIARKLVARRAAQPILTTSQFAEIVRDAIPARTRFASGGGKRGGIDPATRAFQALRIAVNDELGNLAGLLAAIERAATSAQRGQPAFLAPGARVGIISFHSLEDRPVKRTFASLVETRHCAEHLARKPLTADDAEIAANPRSRSAKFRAIRLLPAAPPA